MTAWTPQSAPILAHGTWDDEGHWSDDALWREDALWTPVAAEADPFEEP